MVTTEFGRGRRPVQKHHENSTERTATLLKFIKINYQIYSIAARFSSTIYILLLSILFIRVTYY